jgi:hypothetical protein
MQKRRGEKGNACKMLFGKLEWKGTVKRPRRRWKDNIKMHLREIGFKGVDQIG